MVGPHGNARKRLADVRGEYSRLREAWLLLDERLTHVADVAADAELRAVVASTPLADRTRRDAEADLGRLQRERGILARRLAALEVEQNRLLDRTFEETT